MIFLFIKELNLSSEISCIRFPKEVGISPRAHAFTLEDFTSNSGALAGDWRDPEDYLFQPGFPPQGTEIALSDTRFADFGRPSDE